MAIQRLPEEVIVALDAMEVPDGLGITVDPMLVAGLNILRHSSQ